MSSSLKNGVLCFALAFAALLAPARAWADTYNIFVLASDEGRFFRGVDAHGTVILAYDQSYQSTCDIYSPGCFLTYTGGSFASSSDTLPTLASDNGTPCTPIVPSGATVRLGVCNNGREAFMGFLTPTQQRPSLYTGPGLSDLLATEGTGIFLYMNGEGDIVWNDPNREYWYEAIDTTTQVPEPGTFVLLATGTLATLNTLHRRRS